MSENHFDLRQAEKLLPELETLISAMMDSKRILDETNRSQAQLIERIVRMGGSRVNLSEAIEFKRRREEKLQALREQIELIQDYGVLIKDLDMGLIDFPTTMNGREAYLCWKFGEESIQHWHYTDEGFASRKPLNENLSKIKDQRNIQ